MHSIYLMMRIFNLHSLLVLFFLSTFQVNTYSKSDKVFHKKIKKEQGKIREIMEYTENSYIIFHGYYTDTSYYFTAIERDENGNNKGEVFGSSGFGFIKSKYYFNKQGKDSIIEFYKSSLNQFSKDSIRNFFINHIYLSYKDVFNDSSVNKIIDENIILQMNYIWYEDEYKMRSVSLNHLGDTIIGLGDKNYRVGDTIRTTTLWEDFDYPDKRYFDVIYTNRKGDVLKRETKEENVNGNPINIKYFEGDDLDFVREEKYIYSKELLKKKIVYEITTYFKTPLITTSYFYKNKELVKEEINYSNGDTVVYDWEYEYY